MDQNQNLPQSNNQNSAPAGQAPTDQKPAEQTPPQQPENPSTPPATPATGSPTPQNSETPPPPPSAPNPTGTPPKSPAAPVKHGKGGLIGAMVVFVLILLGAAGVIVAKGMHPMSTQKVVPTITQTQQQPTAVPSQTTEQEINNVDTGASQSSDLKDVQNDINSLNK